MTGARHSGKPTIGSPDAPSGFPEFHRRITLGDGECHFRLGGPAGGPVLLMIHGATVPGWEFDRLAPLLQAAGIRTLVPDLYGHGLSARPRRRYDYRLFTRQMTELLDSLAVEPPVDIFGHSMGAAVGARLAQQNSRRFGRLVLAAPLVDFTGVMTSARLLALPAIGELLMPLYIKPMLKRRRRLRYQALEDGRWVEMFMRQLRIPGFGRMLLSLLRCGTLGDQRACYAGLNRLTHDLLVLRGDEDAIMPRQQFEELRDLLPRARFVEFDGAPHAFVITDPERLAPLVVDFLARRQTA